MSRGRGPRTGTCPAVGVLSASGRARPASSPAVFTRAPPITVPGPGGARRGGMVKEGLDPNFPPRHVNAEATKDTSRHPFAINKEQYGVAAVGLIILHEEGLQHIGDLRVR